MWYSQTGFVVSFFSIGVILGAHGLAAQKSYPLGRGPVKWVSTEWLQSHLKDPGLIIVDVQPDVHDYIVEHIPGAVYLSDQTLRASDKGVPARYLRPEAMEILLRQVGLDNDSPTVVYTGKGANSGQGSGLGQTMMAYTLARFGHNNVLVLDGGLDKWKAENRPLTQEFPRMQDGSFRARVHEEYFADMEQVKNLKDQDDVILLDARPITVYEGKGPWPKAGHIPGAVSLPWPTLMADDNTALLKGDQPIQRILDERHVTPDKTVVIYCGTGREATNEFLLFKWYLGYPNVRIYEGSFTEWCAYPENPTVTGPNPR